MSDDREYLIRADLLPEVYQKVLLVKKMLSSGEAASVSMAVKKADLSRSAYYKYRDAVRPASEGEQSKTYSFIIICEDFDGILWQLVDMLRQEQVKVLTITQNYPVNGLKDISVVGDFTEAICTIDELLQNAGRIRGVREYRLLSKGRKKNK